MALYDSYLSVKPGPRSSFCAISHPRARAKGGCLRIDGDLRDGLLAALDEELPGAVGLRRRLHAEPEPSHKEHRTAQAIVDYIGDTYTQNLDGTALIARVGSGGPPMVLRAELDGLPISEQTGVDFAATNGLMHACGHDVHMAALAAVFRATQRLRDRLPIPLSALFQHSEEAYPSGALAIVDQGVLNGATAIVGVHVHPEVPWGLVSATPGFVNASSDNFRIVVEGAAGHGGYPHTAHDPVLSLCHIVVMLQQIVSRRVDPTRGVVLTVATLKAGRTANAIPATAEAEGTLRASDSEDRPLLRSLLREVVENTALAGGCKARVDITEGEPAVTNDAQLAEALRHVIPQVGLEIGPAMRSFGSDDFGYYGSVAPSMMLFVGLKGGPQVAGRPLHHPEFMPPDETVAFVARAMVAGYLGAAALRERPSRIPLQP